MKKRFLAIFIVVMMLFSQITVFASVPDSGTTSTNPEDKLTDELKEVMNNTADDEYIPVVVWLNDYGDDIVYSKLSKDYGITLSIYNEDIYLQNKVFEQVKSFEEKYQLSSEHFNGDLPLKEIIKVKKLSDIRISKYITEYEQDKIIQNELNIKEAIKTSEENKYISDWRSARKEINKNINNSFILKLDDTKCQNVEVNPLLTCISLECEKSYIYTLANNIEVTKIEPNKINYISSLIESDAIEQQTTEVVNEHHMLTIDTLGYDGTGVRIGVLEARDGDDGNRVLIDEDNVHLYQKMLDGSIQENYSFCGVPGTKAVDSHATSVLSVLCGKEVNGYQGIAPDASIYFAPFNGYPNESSPSVGEMYNALDWVINECNVSIINMSCAHWYTGTDLYYSFLDNYFDCLVSQYRVTIVVASGNGYYQVGCPGMAMNVITVGNLSKETTNGKYQVWHESAYTESQYMSNKPDVVAYGVGVHMYDVSYTNLTDTTEPNNLGTGTSLAAPQVAGLVALMMEANQNLKGKPDAVKSILTLNAEHNVNSGLKSPTPTTATGVVATVNLTNAGGAGLIDIKESIKSALRDDFQRFYLTNSNTSIITNRYYFNAEQSIEFSLCFEKSNHSEIDYDPYEVDINLQILNSEDTVVFDTLHKGHKDTDTLCSSELNNIENYSVAFPESGIYTFRIYVMSGNFDDVEGVTIPNVHETSHEGTYVSLSLSCGCYDKNITSSFVQYYTYEHSCSSCNSTFSENFSYDNETVNVANNGVNYGEVIHTIKFRTNSYTRVIIDNVYSCKSNETENSLYQIEIGYSVGAPEYKYTGYQQSISCVYTVYNKETGAYVCTVYDTIKIVYDTTIECSAYIVT